MSFKITVICNARWGFESLDFPNGIPLGRYGRTARVRPSSTRLPFTITVGIPLDEDALCVRTCQMGSVRSHNWEIFFNFLGLVIG